MNDNPLASPQRENKGAETSEKYAYQYHWALCRIIDEQREQREYVLFMEYHEDVTLGNSLNAKTVEFEFNQVKNIKGSGYTSTSLIRKKKTEKNSVLGKLICSVNDKPFKDKITSINLVASCGFTYKMINEELNLDVISIGDLTNNSINELQLALNKELGISNLPDNLCFITPDLEISNQQDVVIGRIARLVSHLYPKSSCDPQAIYRNLIDELNRKGMVTYDYKKWDRLLKNKALTSVAVSNAIITQVNMPGRERLFDEVNYIASDLGLDYLANKRLRQSVNKIHLDVIGSPKASVLRLRELIYQAMLEIPDDKKKNTKNFIDYVESVIPDKTKKTISSAHSIRDYIIYELIVREDI